MVILLKINLFFLLTLCSFNTDYYKLCKNKAIILYNNFRNIESIELSDSYLSLNETFEFQEDNIIDSKNYNITGKNRRIIGTEKDIIFLVLKKLYNYDINNSIPFFIDDDVYYLGDLKTDLNIASKIFFTEKKEEGYISRNIYLINNNRERITSAILLSGYSWSKEWGSNPSITSKLVKNKTFLLHWEGPTDLVSKRDLKKKQKKRINKYKYLNCDKFKINKEGMVKIIKLL